MRAAPSKFAEAVVRLLLPPAAREQVLGDLKERYSSPRQYFHDAASAVPCVILSRIRRTTDPAVLMMEALVLYMSFFAAAWYLDTSFLSDQNSLFRIAIPTASALLGFLLVDAYADPAHRWVLKPILQAALGTGFAFLSQATLATNRAWQVPPQIMLTGGAMSLLLISAIRMLLAASDQRPTGTG